MSTKKTKTATKKTTGKAATHSKKKAGNKTAMQATKKASKAATQKQKAKSGTPFEMRARDALQFIHPTLKAEHDLELPMRYLDWPRQFDVGLLDGTQVRRVFEAKDYKSRVAFEKVEAFETKVREMKTPPLDGAGVISAHGFQKGPVERTRVLGSEAVVRELYQLRETRPKDWKSRVGSMRLALRARSLDARNVRITLGKTEAPPPAGFGFSADRSACFLFDARGNIKGNILDTINDRLRTLPVSLRKNDTEEATTYEPIVADFEADTFLRLEDRLLPVLHLEFTPAARDLDTSISVDFQTGARDTLIDVLQNREWIIPDPNKALAASRSGYDVALTYEEKTAADLQALSLPAHAVDEKNGWTAQLANAIQMQCLLRAIGSQDEEAPSDGAPAELTEKLARATELLQAGDHAASKTLYWETCATATSLVALVNLTFIYERERDLEQALRLALRTIELFPLEVEGFVNAVAVCMALDRLDDARRLLESGRDLHAGNPELMRKEAELLKREHRWSDASAAYAHLCAINRNDAKARLNLAVCEEEQGLRDAAAWDALQAHVLGLEAPELIVLVVEILSAAGRFLDAVKVGRAALEKIPATASDRSIDRLRVQTAGAAYEAGLLNDAEGALAPVRSNEPAVIYIRGLLQHARGDLRGAYESFRCYAMARPDDRRGSHNLSISATGAGLHEEAHAALRARAFDAEDTRDYWTMRAMAAARAGDAQDALRSAERAGSHEVDVAHLLIACSDAANVLDRHEAGARLRVEALRFASEDGETILSQALVLVGMLMQGQGNVADVDARLDRAEQRGVHGADLIHARMMVALCGGTGEQIARLTPLMLTAGLTAPQALMLAAEAEIRGRSQLAISVLDQYRPEPVTGSRWFRLPHPDAIRASAMLRLGRPLEQARPLIDHLRTQAAHPFHDVITAFWCYGMDDLERALSLLDHAGELTGQGETIELPLRLQCLVELGRYRAVVALLHAHFPQLPVTRCAARWSHNGDVDVEKVFKLAATKMPELPEHVRVATALYRGAEHALLMLRGGELLKVIVAAYDWEGAFSHAAELEPTYTPILVRATAAPLATIQRLRAMPIG